MKRSNDFEKILFELIEILTDNDWEEIVLENALKYLEKKKLINK